jgi:hypothetical protein
MTGFQIEGKTPSALADYLERRTSLLTAIIEGIRGKPFEWGESERKIKMHQLEKEFGIKLVSENAIKRAGHVLKPRATPVGRVYYGAPIQKLVDVYVLGVHTRKKD